MRLQTIYRYIFTLLFSLGGLLVCLPANAQTDTTEAEDENPPERKKYQPGHQLAIGIDVLYPVLNSMVQNKYSYEGEAHYYLKNEYYAVAEGGWGGSKVEYTDLKYSTTNYFGRVGFNKSILYRESAHDWDMMFVGLRLAWADVSRSAAAYSVSDSLWGTFSGTSPAKSFGVLWTEITLGMRVELVHGMLAGWNVRGKFLMNGKSFNDLQPLNIAGFGKGDKNAVFDFNVYLSYAIRWNRRDTAE